MNLPELRKSKKMTQAELSKATGISKRVIQAYEQGDRDINGAKLDTLLSLAIALNCDLSRIITDANTICKLTKYQNSLLPSTTDVV